MFDAEPNDWTPAEIARYRELLSALRYRYSGRRFLPRSEWELLPRRERWRDMLRGQVPPELPYDQAVRARRARDGR